MSIKLILIRHGLTAWNLEKRYCGFKDIPLAKEGRRQARRLKKRLEKEPIQQVYSSDRKRARETAKIIFPEAKIKAMPGLKEMSFGCFEGLTYARVLKKYPRIYKKWLNSPFSAVIPKGEGLAGFRRRVTRAFRKIISGQSHKTIAVVCHGGTIGIFIAAILKSRDFFKYIPAPASLTIVEYGKSGPKIRLLNDTSHLNG